MERGGEEVGRVLQIYEHILSIQMPNQSMALITIWYFFSALNVVYVCLVFAGCADEVMTVRNRKNSTEQQTSVFQKCVCKMWGEER